MKDENYTIMDFINAYEELKNSLTATFDKSFHKDIVDGNIKLISEKRYVITDKIWNINEEDNFKFICLFTELLKSYDKEYIENVEKIHDIFAKNIPFSKQFTINVLQNEHKIIFDFASENNIKDDFISFFSIFLVYPYRKAVAKFITNKTDIKNHVSGLCPVCGHWPGISYLTEKDGKKIMACICCGSTWAFRRLKCSFCMTTDKEALGYINIEGVEDISAYVCDKCRRYLKTVKVKDEESVYAKKWPVIDYLTSGDVDIAAMQNKYLQEPILATRFQGPLDKHFDLYIQKSM